MIHILTFFVLFLVWRSLISLTHNENKKVNVWKGIYLVLGFCFVLFTPIYWLTSLLLYLEADPVLMIISSTALGLGLLIAIVKTTNKPNNE